MLKDWDLHRREQWSNILHLTVLGHFEFGTLLLQFMTYGFGKKVIIGFGVVGMQTKCTLM